MGKHFFSASCGVWKPVFDAEESSLKTTGFGCLHQRLDVNNSRCGGDGFASAVD